ncbi:MAG TPA: hypothetical protein VNG71_16865 [Pyrinomonadaceae bacterium]|nr:hypothetical protein [Pyrinomonadaceae bacterium]
MPSNYLSQLRTVLRWAFLLAMMILAAQAGRLLHLQIKNRTNVQAAHVRKPIPYTTTLRETVHGPDGTTTQGLEYTYSVRSDGSTLLRSVGKGSQRILNYSSGLQVDTNEDTLTKSSIGKAREDPANWQRDPDSKCLNSLAGTPMTSAPETFLGEETIAGYRTVRITSGSITSWHALDYGCALVKERWEFNSTEVSEKELVALVGGEPNAGLFDVAPNYREVPPSERILGVKKECAACNEHSLQVLKKLDDDYKRLKAMPK